MEYLLILILTIMGTVVNKYLPISVKKVFLLIILFIINDYADMHRETAPLKQAEDAVLADTSKLDFEQSVELVCKIIRSKTEGR